MIKERSEKPDFILLAAVTAAVILGVLILSSASALLSQSKYHDSYYLIRHQLIMGIFPGVAAGILAYKVPLRFMRKWAPFLLLMCVSLLILVFIPGIGFSAGGAQRWINLGVATLQPSELLKLAFIVYLASWLASRTRRAAVKKESRQTFANTLAAFAVVVGFIGFLLIKQPDLSTFGVIALTAFVMYFLSQTPLKHALLIGLAGALLLAILVFFEPYRLSRLLSWISPESDPLGKSFQSKQALMLSGSGGILGQGMGSSSQKYTLLPELIGDSIFAPYAHEFGLIGGLALIIIFMIFAWRGFLIAKKSRDKFEYLTAFGITFWIVLQAMINISATIGLLPLSGIPLPFISYGGTAIAVELTAVGVLLNISRRPKVAGVGL